MLNYFEIIKSDLRLIKSCILVSVTSLTAIVTYICIVTSNILKVDLQNTSVIIYLNVPDVLQHRHLMES
jgi:hypothetical protein